MDYKEKLRLAQEALDSGSYDKETIEFIFPELKESEGDRIREKIIALVNAHGQGRFKESMLDWLEKQGSNLVENGYTNNKDIIKYADNYSHAIWHKLMDNFKNIKDYHIGCNDVSDIVLNAIIDAYNWLEKQGEQKKCCGEVNDIAMQQQLQIWFDKGKCSGRDEVIFHPEIYGLQKQGEQKPTEWSHEDDVMVHDILGCLPVKTRPEYNQRRIDWVKSLKDRIQSRQEWSDEDNENMNSLCVLLDQMVSINAIGDEHSIEYKNWLKSLKQRYTWKPSDEQITWLYRATDEAKKDSRMKQVLNELLYDLKKL